MSLLFEPVRIGGLEIKNRFIRSATYYALSDGDGYISEAYVDLMRSLAKNEVGLIMTGYAFVLKSGQASPDMNGIQDDDHIPGYQAMTKAVHDAGGKIALQIMHGGLRAQLAARTGGDYMTVSLLDNPPDFGGKAREMKEEDILNIIGAFGQAGRRAREAGFDGVQIHGAHGYLVSQFLSPLNNRRRDRWGGSLANRLRFTVEAIRAIKRQAGADFPVMIKFGARDYLKRGDGLIWGRGMEPTPGPVGLDSLKDNPGLTIEEGAEAAGVFEKEGLSLIEVSHGLIGTSSSKMHLGITSPEKEAYFLGDARALRQTTTGPLALVAGLRSLPVMEEIIRSGTADCISLSRPLIREPDLIKRWKEGDRRPADCISCEGCHNRDESGKMHVYCRQLRKGNSSPQRAQGTQR